MPNDLIDFMHKLAEHTNLLYECNSENNKRKIFTPPPIFFHRVK